MFARILKINLRPYHVAKFNEALEKQVLLMLRKEKGFQDEITLAGKDGTEMVSISLWDCKESAESYNGQTYPEVMKALAPAPVLMQQAQASLAAASCKLQTDPAAKQAEAPPAKR